MTTPQPPDGTPVRPPRAGPDENDQTIAAGNATADAAIVGAGGHPTDAAAGPVTDPPADTGGVTVLADEDDPDPDGGGNADAPARPQRGIRGRVRPLRRLQRFAGFLVRSRRGVLLLLVLIGGAGAMVMLGGMVAADYSETPAFCGQCHTMDPELKAYGASAHREVTCAECHVEPGIGGMVKAKMNGTKQLVEVLTGTFPKPIPPPDHTEMPSVKDTCMRCHSLEGITSNEGPVGLVLRPAYQTDEKNTRELIAVVLRPVGLGGENSVKGVHWHVQQNVRYAAADPRARKIGLVEVTRPDGGIDRYIGAEDITTSSNVLSDITRLKAEGPRTMDCMDCHNRVGHAVPSIDQALDNAMAAGRISADLPYIKKRAAALLNGNYPSTAAADRAFDGLPDTYRAEYPAASYDAAKLAAVVTELKEIYRQVATPEMKVRASTYPDNLGHQSGAGCFRCHDGAHYKVVNGKVSSETIPSTCSTCHTFPQIGGSISVVPLAGQPASHTNRLYVFTHRTAATSADPVGQTCGTCHDRSYCQNCHNSGAAKVSHDAMLMNHPAVVRRTGGQACAYCHQAAYCATCHTGPVLQRPPQSG